MFFENVQIEEIFKNTVIILTYWMTNLILLNSFLQDKKWMGRNTYQKGWGVVNGRRNIQLTFWGDNLGKWVHPLTTSGTCGDNWPRRKSTPPETHIFYAYCFSFLFVPFFQDFFVWSSYSWLFVCVLFKLVYILGLQCVCYPQYMWQMYYEYNGTEFAVIFA